MALRKKFTFTGNAKIKTDYGVVEESNLIVALNAYIKVEEVKASKASALAIISMIDGDKKLTTTADFVPSVEDGAKNIIAQAYEAIKKLPMFENATDC